jgi:alginate O-acetyltransferase complex protein AlgI
VRHFYLLFVVILGWVFFRADDLGHALVYMKALFGFSSAIQTPARFAVLLNSEILLLIPLATVLCLPISNVLRSVRKEALTTGNPSGGLSSSVYTAYTVVLGALFFLSCMSLAGGTHKAFIYFKF